VLFMHSCSDIQQREIRFQLLQIVTLVRSVAWENKSSFMELCLKVVAM
jgi:hypothetical protein